MTIRRKRLSLLLGALFITAAGIGSGQYHRSITEARAASAPAPATAVDVADVVSQRITEWQGYSGRLEAVDKVEIRPLASGRIVAVHFKDGAIVKKGGLLFTIDPQPYTAELERAQAQVAAAEARVAYASSEFARNSACWRTTPSPVATSRRSAMHRWKRMPLCAPPRPQPTRHASTCRTRR